MHLIGINGFKRSGKGTVADIVEGIYATEGRVVKGVGFADKLKILAARSLGYSDLTDADAIALMDYFKEDGYIWAENDHDKHYFAREVTGRQYLQNIGNEARGIFGDTFWIDMVLPNPIMASGWSATPADLLESRYPDVDVVCITDLRYPNEAERVKALGGVVWEVLRPGVTSDGHASEKPLPRELVDRQIDNSGTINALEGEVETALEALGA